MLVTTLGCPAGIGPEVALRAAARTPGSVLVGDRGTLEQAAALVGVDAARLVPWSPGERVPRRSLPYVDCGPALGPSDRRPGKPSRRAGLAQLAWIERGYELVQADPARRALVTGPVSKAAIARSGRPDAGEFRGHTEWLQQLDGAASSVMCFASRRLVTSLVTTHLPLAEVPRALAAEQVAHACVALAELLGRLGHERPRLAVCALNPHAGEGELLGDEERRSILPGLELARRRLGRRARLVGPVGAETAYRKAYAGQGFDGVVAMYHDQATIPMKLVAFGDAVNVTWGLGVVRTSVDHGTGYDIAWQGRADDRGMRAALVLAKRLLAARGPWAEQPGTRAAGSRGT